MAFNHNTTNQSIDLKIDQNVCIDKIFDKFKYRSPDVKN